MLLDNPLSAVDQHTSKHIFDYAIKGLLKDKAVVLIAHQLELLPQVSHPLVLLCIHKTVARSTPLNSEPLCNEQRHAELVGREGGCVCEWASFSKDLVHIDEWQCGCRQPCPMTGACCLNQSADESLFSRFFPFDHAVQQGGNHEGWGDGVLWTP